MDASLAYANQLKGLLAKADGKDKFVALLQYAAMFVSAGEPGRALSVQKSFSAARKPFRAFKPAEFIMPLLEKPPKGKGLAALLAYVGRRERGHRLRRRPLERSAFRRARRMPPSSQLPSLAPRPP